MEVLLLGGGHNVGKTTAIRRLTSRLMAKGFVIIAGTLHPSPKDFAVVLEGVVSNGSSKKVIINSATDTPKIISNFKKFFDLNGTYDIMISSVRDDGYSCPRKEFFAIMGLIDNGSILEIPLGKVRKGDKRPSALKWYEDKIDFLCDHILNRHPYNI